MTLNSAVQRMTEELRRVRPFDVLPREALQQLAAAVHLDFFESLDALELDPSNIQHYYLVQRGAFIVRQGSTVLAHHEAPAIIGWHQALYGEVLTNEVLFTEESIVLEMPIAETRYLLSKYPQVEDFMKERSGYVLSLGELSSGS
ncbi:MAG: hypothetical protein P8N56_05000 [Schleiferiaceae bacterium]|nr:hypothetical protein [Schleiferiaceae bacterium]